MLPAMAMSRGDEKHNLRKHYQRHREGGMGMVKEMLMQMRTWITEPKW